MEIVPGVHMVPGTRLSRVYLIEDDELTLVDTGMPWSAARVYRYIESVGRRPEEIVRILMTHGHPDHTGAAAEIRLRSGAELAAHRLDAKAWPGRQPSLDYMGLFNAFDAPLPFLRRAPVDAFIADGDVLPIGGGIRALHTPGHTPGSVCFFMGEHGLLFGGDTIFSDGLRVSRAMPFPGSDAALYRHSLERLAGMRFDLLCGGHGAPLAGGASDMLRHLLAAKPELPTWGEFMFKRLPRRLVHGLGLTTEDY